MKRTLSYFLSIVLILPIVIASVAFIADQLDEVDMTCNAFTIQEEEDSEEEVEVDSEEDMFINSIRLDFHYKECQFSSFLVGNNSNHSEPTIKVIVPPPEFVLA